MKPVRMYHHESSMKTLVHIVHKEEVQYGGGFKRDYFRATSRGKGKAAFKNLEAPSDYQLIVDPYKVRKTLHDFFAGGDVSLNSNTDAHEFYDEWR